MKHIVSCQLNKRNRPLIKIAKTLGSFTFGTESILLRVLMIEIPERMVKETRKKGGGEFGTERRGVGCAVVTSR